MSTATTLETERPAEVMLDKQKDCIVTVWSAGIDSKTMVLKRNRARGVLVKDLGIVTVEHVVHGMTEINVEFFDGKRHLPHHVASLDVGLDLLALAFPGASDNGYEIRSDPLHLGDALHFFVSRPEDDVDKAPVTISSRVERISTIIGVGDVYLIAFSDGEAVSGSPAFDDQGFVVGVIGGTLGSDAIYVIRVQPSTIHDDQWIQWADYATNPRVGLAKARAMRSESMQHRSFGRLQDARDQLNEIMKIAPDYILAKATAADIDLRLGHVREAEELYTQVSANLSFAPSVWWWLARSREHLGNFEGAIEAYDEFLSLERLVSEPEQSEAQYRLGCAMIAVGRIQEGTTALSRIAGASEYSAGLRAICEKLLVLKEYEAVLQIAHAMPDMKGGTLAVRAMARQGQLKEAVTLLRETRDFQGSPIDENLAWAVVLLDCEMYEESLERARLAVEHDEDNPEVWYVLGRTLERTSKHKQAAAAFHRALEIQPEYFQAWWRVGYVLLEQGDRVAAVSSLSRAFELRPDQAWLARVLCDLHLQDGKCDTALAVASMHADACARSASALLILGDVLIKCDEPRRAVQMLEEARTKGEHAVPVLAGLVRALRDCGREEEADRVEEELRRLAHNREIDCDDMMKLKSDF